MEDCLSPHLSTKIQVCRPVFVPTLLYSADTWVLHQKQIRLPERFYQRCLRSILGIKWEKKTKKKTTRVKRRSLEQSQPAQHRVHLASDAVAMGRQRRKDEKYIHAQAVFFSEI